MLRGQTGGHVAMLTFSALVAGSFTLGAMVANLVPPIALTAARFLLAALAIAALALGTTGIPRATFRAPWRYALLGGVFAIYFILMFEGLKTATPVATAAVFTLTPLMSAGFGKLLLGQRMTRRMLGALVLGAVGALWVIFRGDLQAFLRFDVDRGEAIFFVGCIAHALYTPLVRKLNRGESPVVFPIGTFLGGFLVMLAVGGRQIAPVDWLSLPGIVWPVLAYLAVVTSAFTLMLLQFATLRLPSAKVMAYTYLVPSWVILWDLAVGQAPPPLRVAVGVALTAAALVLLLKDEDAART
jgi:drug/metabolite transporter (DMT)-like permease